MINVLLYGDYSRVHWTLAQGLKKIGIHVKVASNGDGFKNYPRDIDLNAKSKFGQLKVLVNQFLSTNYTGYDVVQLIGYCLYNKRYTISKKITQHLKKTNKRLFLGAFGDDYYWISACMNRLFDYSFVGINAGNEEIMNRENIIENIINRHYSNSAFNLNQYVAQKCDGIIAGAYDYWLPYNHTIFNNKLEYIPLPINTEELEYSPNRLHDQRVVFLIGAQKGRYFWKGLDVVHPILLDFKKRFPSDIELVFAENIPYDEYRYVLDKANIIVDQIYSMSPGMNALTSLAKGKVVLSGAEASHYSIIGEEMNKPIINITPDKKQVIHQIEYILDSRENIENMGLQGRMYIEKHHDYRLIAKKYIEVWEKSSLLI